MTNVDWRAIYKPLGLSRDTQEHIDLAKGKEIKRGKDETRGICLAYIEKMTKDSADRNATAIISEEFQKETFWERVGLKKVDKEKPLYALGKDKLAQASVKLQDTMQQTFVGQ